MEPMNIFGSTTETKNVMDPSDSPANKTLEVVEDQPACMKRFNLLMKQSEEMAKNGESLHLMQQDTAYALYDVLNDSSIDKYAKKSSTGEFVYLFHNWMWHSSRIGPVHRSWVSTAIMEKAEGTKKDFMNFTFSDAIFN